MPVQYSGILDEHRAVRQRVGLFDLSHMGEVWVERPRCRRQDWPRPSSATRPRLAEGRAHYSMICADDGGIIDDLIVYRVADERFMVVPNASNREAVVAALARAPAPVMTPRSTTRRCARRSSPYRAHGPRSCWRR